MFLSEKHPSTPHSGIRLCCHARYGIAGFGAGNGNEGASVLLLCVNGVTTPCAMVPPVAVLFGNRSRRLDPPPWGRPNPDHFRTCSRRRHSVPDTVGPIVDQARTGIPADAVVPVRGAASFARQGGVGACRPVIQSIYTDALGKRNRHGPLMRTGAGTRRYSRSPRPGETWDL